MAASPPTVSVVIPCLDDAELLAGALASLARQTRAPLEVVVVDNGSTDGSARVAKEAGALVVTEPVRGIPAAAAAGYDAAAGDIIARCDADCVLPPDWIEKLQAAFAADPMLSALSGPGRFRGFPRPLARAVDRLYLGSYYLAMGAALAHRPLFASNLALRRTVWEQVRSEVHRADPEQHDDVCLSFHLGQRFRCAYRSDLAVAMDPRAVLGAANLRRRFRRAFHTLRVHWRDGGQPWVRWQLRLAGGRAPAGPAGYGSGAA